MIQESKTHSNSIAINQPNIPSPNTIQINPIIAEENQENMTSMDSTNMDSINMALTNMDWISMDLTSMDFTNMA